jgi:transposase InsO family protein
MCRVLEASRSGYYVWKDEPVTKKMRAEAELVNRIFNIHRDSKETYGSPRIREELKKLGIRVSENRVAQLMRGIGLRAKTKRKFKHTTNSQHQRPVSPNLLVIGEKVVPTQANEVWVGDITHIRTAEGWLYLAVVLDLFSRRVVGWAMANRMIAKLVIDALLQAITHRGMAPLIFHSDRGTQYASREFQQMLQQHGIFGSMSGAGNCYDNAWSESFFHTLKTEHVYFECYPTRYAARVSIFEYTEVFYNLVRSHSTLGYMSPAAFELAAVARLCG